jgi:hypothetical protein
LNARGKDRGRYKITGMNVEHNHEVTEAAYLTHSSNRRVNTELKKSTEDMSQTGLKVS